MNMHKSLRFSAVFCLIGCLAGWATFVIAAPKPSKEVGTSSVWQLPEQLMAGAHTACDKAAPAGFAECVIDQMAKAGASADAVSFTRELYKQSSGEVGIMTGFQAVSPVDFAWITYPLRPNTNYGLLLVNGEPPIVNLENLTLLDRKTMQRTPQFKDLQAQFPQVDVWPGDRDGKTWPNSQPGPNGGVQFTVGYPLINGCHACAHAGSAIFTWNFSAQGKFLGTTFVGMTPPPLQQ
jgi:hypothetical protein